MKRKSMILIAMILSLHCAQMSAQKKMIVMGGQYNDPLNEKERPSRMPSTPIYIYQDGRKFLFTPSNEGDVVEIMSNSITLYKALIDENGCIQVPNDIFGEIELHLIKGGIVYYVIVEI